MCGCAAVTSSDSTDKCIMMITFWYQIYASSYNEDGTFLLLASVNFFILEVFLSITAGTIYKKINLSLNDNFHVRTLSGGKEAYIDRCKNEGNRITERSRNFTVEEG